MDSGLVEKYWKDGFVTGIPVLSAEEVRRFRDRFFALEARAIAEKGGSWPDRDYLPYQDPAHRFRALYADLARLPKLLDAVEAVLGPNLLVRNGDVFIKEPDNPGSDISHVISSLLA